MVPRVGAAHLRSEFRVFAVLRAEDGPVLLLIVKNPARAADHAGKRILVHVNRQARLMAEQEVEAAIERAAAGHDDATIDDVACKLRGSDFQGAADGIDDLLNRLLD